MLLGTWKVFMSMRSEASCWHGKMTMILYIHKYQMEEMLGWRKWEVHYIILQVPKMNNFPFLLLLFCLLLLHLPSHFMSITFMFILTPNAVTWKIPFFVLIKMRRNCNEWLKKRAVLLYFLLLFDVVFFISFVLNEDLLL